MTDKTLPTLVTAATFSNAGLILSRLSGDTEDKQLQGSTLSTYIFSQLPSQTVTAAQISDSTAVGRSILRATTTADAQNIVGPSANTFIRTPGITVDGGGSTPSTGSKGYLTVPYAGTISNWYMAADVSGSAVIDVKRSGASIVGGSGNKPTLSGDKFANASAASWTSNTITAGDIIEYNLDSATTISRVNLVLKVTVT